jgi:hypothetical protein
MTKQQTISELMDNAQVKPRRISRNMAYTLGALIGIATVTGIGTTTYFAYQDFGNKTTPTSQDARQTDTNEYQTIGPQNSGKNILPVYNLSTNEVGTQ